MAFATLQATRAQRNPVYTYLFEWGNASYYAYCSHETEDVVLDDMITYTHVAITHGNRSASGSLDKSQLRITLQRDLAIRGLFLIWPPSSVVTVTIREGNFDDPDSDYVVVWKGRVLSYEREGSEAVMMCQPIATAMRRPNLRRYYQIQCPHLLYGADCRASRTAKEITGTVASLSTSAHSITLVAGWNGAVPAAKYRQGEVTWTDSFGETQMRTILAVSGNTLTLSGPLIDLIVSQTVVTVPGCNHLTSAVGGSGDCTNLHVQASNPSAPNGPNFGGCKWIPKKNPVGIRNGWY